MEQSNPRSNKELLAEIDAMRWQLDEATDTIHAIRTGQIDALVVHSEDGPQLYSLKTADQTYRVFIEKMNEGALTLNEEGIILYCNSMFAQMVDMPLANVLGTPFADFVAEESAADFQALFTRGWMGDAKEEMLIYGRDRLIPCQLSVTTLQLDEGVSLSVIVTDLSYQKETQAMLKANNEQLKAANAALERSNYDLLQFASVASHDLQEPLRKIMVFSGMLAKKIPPEAAAETATIIGKIATSSHRMKSMISDILAYSRLAQDSIAMEDVNLNEILAEIIDDFEILITEKQAIIEIGDLPTVTASRGQMRQVFQNLLSNAIKFSKPGIPPHIQVTCATDTAAATCTVSVKDNGIGFDQQYREKIFALFQRLNTKDQYDGSGIGLAIAKKIIDQHKGHIVASSEEGIGSTFRITLPLRKE
jgi:two-component system CheB/CheR fusion protein